MIKFHDPQHDGEWDDTTGPMTLWKPPRDRSDFRPAMVRLSITEADAQLVVRGLRHVAYSLRGFLSPGESRKIEGLIRQFEGH